MKKRNYIVAALMLVVAVAAAVLVGCKKEKSTDNGQNLNENNQIGNSIGDTDDILFFNHLENVNKYNPGGIDIIRIDLRRKSTNCQEGIGICNIYIFGEQIYKSEQDSLMPSREILYEINTNQKSDNLVLLIANDVSSFNPEELDLFVDEDIYGYDDNTTKRVIVPQGIYQYDPNLGKYGGYTVGYSFSRI